MATFTEVSRLSEKITRDAQRWYDENDVPAAFRRLHPLVLARARLLSDGDWHRCVVDPGGQSVVVHNYRVWDWE